MIERIIQIRKEYKLSQEEFAKKLGLSRNFINQAENRKKNFSDRTISDICRKFSVNEEWLRTGVGDMFIIPEDDTAALVSDLLEEPDDEFYQAVLEFVRTYKQLSPESRSILCEFGNMYLENMKNRKE